MLDRSYQYSIKIVQLIDTMPKDSATAIIARQLLRSATSVGANLVEAKGASSRKDFTNFFTHSLKSANESLYWLCLLKDARGIGSYQLKALMEETNELARMLGASILTLKGKRL